MVLMFSDSGNRVHSHHPPASPVDTLSNCAVFIAHFIDGYRVIYRMNGEWLLDSLEQTLTHARLKAERCIDAMVASNKCPKAVADIFEISISAELNETMKCGLRDPNSDWQHFMTHAAMILCELDHVHTVSFITDSRQANKTDHQVPYLFVVSSRAFGNRHHIDTVRLRKSRPSLRTGITHEVSEGKALWHDDNMRREHKLTSPVVRKKRSQSIFHYIAHRVQSMINLQKTGFGF